MDQKIRNLPLFYPHIRIENYVVMPNHVHLILFVAEERNGIADPANSTVPSLISSFKRFTNKEADFSLWHRSYYDHVIRNDSDFQNIWKYISDNPAKWMEDRFYIPDP